MTTHTQLFLAPCRDWTHRDGTAPVRVHLQLTETDAHGGFWATRGTSQTQGRKANEGVLVRRDDTNRLIRDTFFVTKQEGLVYLHQDDVIRVTGKVDQDTFNQVWDLIQA